MRICSALILLVFFNSCVNTKRTGAVWIPKDQIIYKVEENPLGNGLDYIYGRKLQNGVSAVVTPPAVNITDGVVGIRLVETPDYKADLAYIRKWQTGDPVIGTVYFSDQDVCVPTNKKRFTAGQFRYVEYKPSIQAFSIPIKYRFSMRDSIKSAASASFNIGFSYAFKFTSNTYKKVYWNNGGSKNFLNHSVKKFTYSFGPFLGPTLVDLKPGNTDGYVTKDRSVVGATYGGFGVIGYNELQIGVAVGFDNIFKTEGGTWIYNKKPWLGFIVALDLIK